MAASNPVNDLATALQIDAEGLAALEQLPPPQLTALRKAFQQAQQRQRADLQKAIDSALKHVPALLRGTVLKILRG